MTAIKKGDRIRTWFSPEADGKSTVLEVKPYTGKYPDDFDCVVVVTSTSKSGRMEMALHSEKSWWERE